MVGPDFKNRMGEINHSGGFSFSAQVEKQGWVFLIDGFVSKVMAQTQ